MRNLILIFLLPLSLAAQKQPRLIVGIVVDQMRYEMLDRYSSDFGPDGFNLLADQGMRFDSCTFSYIPTYTAPGHATIYTGVSPRRHAILANDLFIPEQGKSRYCVVDEDVKPIGTTDPESRRSPLNLRAYTVGDSLKMQDDASRVIAVSIKDRGAILPGGKNADAAYWMNGDGQMVSSSYYMSELPMWVDRFNRDGYTARNALSTWDYFQEKTLYDESLPDASPYESRQFGDTNVLPYNISRAIRAEGLGVLRKTPFGNSLLTEFAIGALREEHLGRDKHTDLLAISYSSTDYIGHAYGPQSVEVQDTYLRLDRELAYLITVLDAEIGRENYVLFLTADHGAANTPIDESFSYQNTSKLKEVLNLYATDEFGVNAIKHIASQQIWLDDKMLIQRNIERTEVIQALQSYMLNMGGTALQFEAVFTKEQIENCASRDCLPFYNAFISTLSGDLFYVRPYGQMERKQEFGTTHGSSHLYDTHVPLLFFGGNVQKGESAEPISVIDIIPLLKTYLPKWAN
jgi:predicted AlkP superfamily pyrophosphatase or phosphodiesterase